MPWELGYFDGFNGNVAIFPIIPSEGSLRFEGEEYLQIYPKVDRVMAGLFINAVPGLSSGPWKSMSDWLSSSDKLKVKT